MLAHDIRSALNGVLGGVAAIDRSELDPSLRLQVDRVSAAAEALGALVLGAVEATPAASPAGQFGAALTLHDLLRSIHRRWAGEAEEKGLSFVLEAAADLPDRLLVDSVALTRVIANLIGNAIKFSRSGVVRLRVTCEPGGGVLFVLHDDGPGLGGFSLRQVCEFGFRQPSLSEPGQGLGLYIAKLLTEEIGGELWLSERQEGGLEAGLRLPGHLCDGPAAGTQSGRADEAGLPSLAGLRVLLAEDNPTNQLVASQMLAAMDATVIVAGDGMEALALFEDEDVDLVVVDIEMPRVSGLDVISAIRSRGDRRARTPVVALTAYAMTEHRLRIAQAGADGLISKPIVSAQAFGAAVAQHVRRGNSDGSPSAAHDQADAPVVDKAAYEGLAETIGADMLPELLDRIVADLEAAAADLAGARDPLDAGKIRASSHIMVSVAGAFGAVRLQRAAAELNDAAHAADPDVLASKVEACLAEVRPAVEFVLGKRTAC